MSGIEDWGNPGSDELGSPADAEVLRATGGSDLGARRDLVSAQRLGGGVKCLDKSEAEGGECLSQALGYKVNYDL